MSPIPTITDEDINGLADLEDFAPLDLYVDPLLISSAVSETARQEDEISVEHFVFLEDVEISRLNVFPRVSDGEDVMTFREGADASITQVQDVDYNTMVVEVNSTPEAIEIDTEGENRFLFEAWGAAFGDETIVENPRLVYRTEITFFGWKKKAC